MEDKEEIYNKVILPLTRQVYDLCKEHGIPYQMCFQVSDEALRGGYCLPETASARLHIVQDIIERAPSGFIASVISSELSEPVVTTKTHDLGRRVSMAQYTQLTQSVEHDPNTHLMLGDETLNAGSRLILYIQTAEIAGHVEFDEWGWFLDTNEVAIMLHAGLWARLPREGGRTS